MAAPTRAIVLVPGAWHGAWCWERVVPLLRARGHRVHTPELHATGADDSDPRTVKLDTWARQVIALIEPEPSRVLLVGHSRGGAVISRVAELAPDRVSRLVYLCAYLLADGDSVAGAARDDPGSLIAPNMVPAQPGVSCTLRPEILREAFYGDCDDATAQDAIRRLRPEPLRPLVTAVRTTPERFGRVPRAYVECTRDRTISPDAQRAMRRALPCEPVFTLESGHSPFLSRPGELAQVLDRL